MRYIKSKIIQIKFLTVIHYLYSSFWLVGVFFLIVNISCTRDERKLSEDEKQRGIKDIFSQGMVDNLYGIEKFRVIELPSQYLDENILKNKALKIRTVKGGGTIVRASSSDEELDAETNVSFVNEYYIIDYDPIGVETDDQKLLLDLLGEVEFKGLRDKVYHIVPHLQNNYLILYRLSAPEDLPYNELPLSVKVGNKVAVPLVGYRIKYCVAEQKVNPNTNEKTGQKRSKCDNVSKASAKYISLDKNQKDVFHYLPKQDNFPNNFFDGEWFFVSTIIESSVKSMIGDHVFSSAKLVKFKREGDSLKLVDATINKLKKKLNITLSESDELASFFIPVKWKEYEMERDSDVIKYFREREVAPERVDKDKANFEIKYEEIIKDLETDLVEMIKSVIGADNAASIQITASLGSPVITDDYFSFVIKVVSNYINLKKKYTFKKAIENPYYIEKQWFETDSNKYFPSFFVSILPDNLNGVSLTQIQSFDRVTRFDPGSSSSSVKVIKWYFSKQTLSNEWVRDFGRKAVDYWNTVFQEAGKGSNYQIRIVLDESADRELGDIRYNIINLVVSPKSSGTLFGYGPRIANPITGEILSATANVWVSTIVNRYIGLIRQYIRFQIDPPKWKLLLESPGVTDFIHEKIRKLCPKVRNLIEDEKGKGRILHHGKPVLDDKELREECAYKMAEVDILNTLLHEMGHGFGYRHLFSASADKNNFYESYGEMRNIFGEDILEDSTDSYLSPAQFSSVMDYAHPYFPGLTVPGKYDIAITKFLYFDKMDLVGGGTVDIPAGAVVNDNNKPKEILEVVGNKKIKKYKACGGKKELVDVDKEDPLCFPLDYGVTPVEVVENTIRAIQDDIILYYSKFYDDRGNEKIELPNINLSNIIRPYNEWMRQLTIFINSVEKNISDYSFENEEDVHEYLEWIETKRDIDDDFKAYYEVRQPIFDFYKKMFFLPVKQCVYQKGDGTYQAVALDIIRTELLDKYSRYDNKILRDCESEVAKEWAELKEVGRFVTEVGLPNTTKSYVLNATSGDRFDELSIFFTTRIGSIWSDNIIDPLAVVFSNDPEFAKELITEQMNTLLKGMDLNPYLSDADKEKLDGEELPRFLSYKIEMMTNVVLHRRRGRQEDTAVEVYFWPLLMKKQLFVSNYIDRELDRSSDRETLRKIQKKHGKRIIQLNSVDVKGLLDTMADNNIPSIIKINEEYGDIKSDNISLLGFLKEHPAICVNAGETQMLIPYDIFTGISYDSSKEDNNYAKICRKFNEYNTCVANHVNQPCEHKKDKEAYINLIEAMLAAPPSSD